jgi:hypothetical protein
MPTPRSSPTNHSRLRFQALLHESCIRSITLSRLTELVAEAEGNDLERLTSAGIYDDPDLATHVALEYVATLLRHYRPEFDALPCSERVTLLKDGCRRVKTFRSCRKPSFR